MRNNRKYAITFSQPSLTQQHSKDEVDINKIMARYIKTGVIDHVAKYQPQYLENTDIDYHESQNIILKADRMFSELPSSVRREFNNDPAKFLEFVSDEENHEKLADMTNPKPEKSKKPEPESALSSLKTPTEEKPKTIKTAPAAETAK